MAARNTDIMIIHQEPEFTKRLEKFLYENFDCTVLSFETLRICLSSRPPQPDIVFVHYHLNDMDGLRAIRLLKKRWKRAVFVLIGTTEQLTAQRLARFGVDITVDGTEELERAVHDALRYHRYKRLAGRVVVSLLAFLSLVLVGLLIYAKA